MGDTNIKENLTTWDKVSVFLYRGGIVISVLCLLYSVLFFFLASKENPSSFFTPSVGHVLFWLFVVCVDISVGFLHLYSKQVLRVIQGFAAFGTILLLGLAFMGDFTLAPIFHSTGVNGKIGLAGLGFVAAGFAGIGAKEAFCFKLNEGYAYGILSALLIIGRFFGIWNTTIALGLLTVICALTIVFTIRKLMLPLHYDIGDKSKY